MVCVFAFKRREAGLKNSAAMVTASLPEIRIMPTAEFPGAVIRAAMVSEKLYIFCQDFGDSIRQLLCLKADDLIEFTDFTMRDKSVRIAEIDDSGFASTEFLFDHGAHSPDQRIGLETKDMCAFLCNREEALQIERFDAAEIDQPRLVTLGFESIVDVINHW